MNAVFNKMSGRDRRMTATRIESFRVTTSPDKATRWAVAIFIALAVLLSVASCQLEASNTNRAAAPPANTNAPAPAAAAPTPVKAEDAASRETALTLPILDAFFAQENFASELKAKLQLTDQQLEQLRSIARQETSKLRETDSADDSTGKAAAAREEAAEKIQSTVGAQKTKDLIAFVNDRWNGGAVSTTPGASPGVVPSDTRIVVNAPAFRMDIFEDGRLIKSYKIGIGYPEFPLPTGLRKADTIIFNPSWTPPDEPWVESAHSKVKVGEKVPAGSELNPLGPIKIPIGLPSLIHGGKSPAKLGTFASHGCVGLTTPQVQDFAARLAQLSGTNLTQEQMAEYLKRKTDTKPVKLARPVQVELRYDTVTVEEGKLHIYRDVYERGTNTEENLRSVLNSYGISLDQLDEGTRAEAVKALSMMSRGATGKPVVEADSSKNSKAEKNNATGKVTRTIKGSKEVAIEVNGLQGKGYPAPVDLDTGVPQRPAVAHKRHK